MVQMDFKKSIIIFIHVITGWVLCGATMGIGRAVTSISITLVIHAILAPLVFTIVSWVYYKRYYFTTPLQTAIIFVSMIIFLDIFVVALLIEKSFEMFSSIFGVWLPMVLIFFSIYLTGLYVKK